MHLIRNIALISLLFTITAINRVSGQRIINVGIHVAPCLSSIKTDFPASIKDLKSEGGLSFNFRISGKYFLTEQVGVSSGFEILGFKQASSASSTYESFNVFYTETQFYERRVWGDSIKENVTLNILHIPLQMFYQHKFNNAVSIFGSLGPGISIPLASKNSGSGIFTYKGYFPEERALLWDIPVYGLSSGVDVKIDNKPELNPMIVNFVATLGVETSINRYYRFTAAIGYYHSLTNVFKNGDSIHVSNQIGSYNSILGTGKNHLSNMWFSIGLSKNIPF